MIDKNKAKKEGIKVGDYTFRTSEDETILYLDTPLHSPTEKRFFIKNYPEIRAQLVKTGVRFILDEPESLDGKIVVAKGQPPKKGSPERIELLPKFIKFSQQVKSKKGATIVAEESKDLREQVQRIICVEKDEVIGKWHPAIPPIPGVNIWGETVEPPPIKEEKNFELGENIYLDEKTKEIKAKIDGVVTIDKGKISILPEYVLKSDVDYSTGNIHFKGKKLSIIGDIKFGFKVICRGDLEIKGCTENKVTIEVEGNLIVDGVIRGEETRVYVKGDAKLRGVEFANLTIDGNLYVKDYLIFSETKVNGELQSIEGKGIIYGGKIYVTKNITLKTAGHPAQTKTEIFAGYKPEIVENYFKLSEKELIFSDTLKKVLYGLELSEKLKTEGRLTPDKERILTKLSIERDKLVEKLYHIKEELKLLREELEKLKGARIKILQRVYPNVILGIAELRHTVSSELSGPIVFYIEDDSIMSHRE